MPTYAAVQLAIETRFRANWTDDDVALRYEQDPRKKPPGKFIRLSIRHLRSREFGISGNKVLYRRQGWVHMQCFVEVGKGTQLARLMADAAILIFEGQQFSSITCRESEIIPVGNDPESIKAGFYQIVAKVFFDFDDEVTVN